MDYYQEKYETLLRDYKKLQRKCDDLEENNRKLYDQLDSANFRIRQELEPRIKREGRRYDAWVTDPER
ncbi:MAG: hypothetical protein K0R00_11 [Herbinix sp.]|jgi:hypothetical protein|nr:hypothetical protein [Herbinix sp.]